MVFIDACFGRETPYTPIWLMRQAGRYLSEYREARAGAGSFLNMCQDVRLATDVSLHPVEVLDVDAAIIFSDILLLPHAMGMDLDFLPKVGPVFPNPIGRGSDLRSLDVNSFENLGFVYEIVSGVRSRLSKDKSLIGFSGAPWTLATYMIEGAGSKTYERTKRLVYSDPVWIHSLLQLLSHNIKHYLLRQISAGADAVMLFDSWANALEYSKYLEFGWNYIQDIASFVRSRSPCTPLIVFPRGFPFLEALEGDFDVLSIDWQIPIDVAKRKVGHRFVLQGNLEPARIYDVDSMVSGIREIVNTMQNKRHIFNLGHGMIHDLPRENVVLLVNKVRELSSCL